jgi:proline iminopeptidase
MTSTSQSEGKVQVPGGNVWYRVTGTGSGTPLLLLHGGPGGGHDYFEPLQDLGDERPIVFYDQLGCGKSDIPDDLSLYDIGRFAEEVGAVREALGLGLIHLLGQSWGGWLAIEYMLGQPEGVASLTLSNTSASAHGFETGARSRIAGLPESVRQAIAEHETAGTTDSTEYLAASLAFMQAHVCRVQPWPDYLARTGINVQTTPTYAHMWGPSEFTMTGNLSTWDRTARLGEIKAPTLVISGPFDEATENLADELVTGIPGAQKVMIEGTSHTPWIENPDDFFPVLREFLRRNEPA